MWISGDDVPEWEQLLVPRSVAPRKGLLRVSVAPDPWTLSLSSTGVDGVRIAAPVQLYLDCSSEGERTVEAAHAMREQTGRSKSSSRPR